MKFNSINTKTTGKGFYLLLLLLVILSGVSCKKQLDVKNPNDPTFGVNVSNEDGLAAYVKGTTYWNGFNYGNGWLGDSYFSLPWGYHELMGDVIGGGQGSNNQTTTMGVPDSFQADPADATTVFTNPTPQAAAIIRSFNNSASTGQGNNALIYEWNSMYSLINSCNITLDILPTIAMSADRANAVKAWCYWWKGFAYGQIGTLYYAGLIYEKAGTAGAKNVFVKQDAIIAESNKNLTDAIAVLRSVSNAGEFTAMLGKIIPSQNQVGLGAAPSPADLIATCNTMLARNILFNKLSPFVNGNPAATISKASIPVISGADWQSILTYCASGLKANNKVFTGRTSEANSFFSPNGGSVAGMCAFSNQNTTYKVSERLVQSYKAGDKRRANFTETEGTFYGDANTNSTRWTLVDFDDAGLSGFKTLGTRSVGKLEIYIGPTYEENALMLAEANIRTGNIEAGLAIIDQVRAYQGAGVAAVAGTGLNLVQALNELTQERYAALAFRGLSFFDARRWGWTYSTANGGGRYGATLIFNKIIYNNAKINYNFMDYWDVPGDEIEKNPPAAGSAAVVNPNF
ncbi:MAG: hypothetical protein RL732_676 [Bacteroidota bacterium]